VDANKSNYKMSNPIVDDADFSPLRELHDRTTFRPPEFKTPEERHNQKLQDLFVSF
jgi:hypothetical protein